MLRRRSPLLPAGWLVCVAVAVLAYIAKPEDELGFSIVVGTLSAAMALWTYRSRGRLSTILSLVLGVLWTLLFGAYAVADFTSNDDVKALVHVGDVVAVVGGILILAGALARLRQTE